MSTPLDYEAEFSNAAPASPANRIIAFVIDIVLVALVGWIPCVGWAAAIVYTLTKDALPFLNGQSVGKKIMKIRAVTESGESLKGQWGPAIIRQVVFFIPFALFVEGVMLFADKKHVRFGDKFAKTKVVNVG